MEKTTIYIYKTTFTDDDGKEFYYIGKRTLRHRTPATENYFGSGKEIKELLENYSKDHFKKEILFILTGDYDQIETDAEAVEKTEIKRALKKYGSSCINCRVSSAGLHKTQEAKDKIRAARLGTTQTKETKEKISHTQHQNYLKRKHKKLIDDLFAIAQEA